MISLEIVEKFKGMAPFLVNLIPGGAVFVISDLNAATWTIDSADFHVPGLQVGTKVRVGGAVHQAMTSRQTCIEKVARAVYGTRVLLTATPVFDGNDIVGAFAVYLPRVHPVANSFEHFAPIIGEVFGEGAVLYVTDLNEYVRVYHSKKFSLPDAASVGMKLSDQTVAKEAMKTRQLAARDIQATVYGVPILSMCYPVFDEDDPSLIIGCFGLALPRQTAVKLKEMSTNLNHGLTEISSVIEELAASASQISDTERQLNQNVGEIYRLSEDINEILAFIKQIADETKMLGLNAAIEAARAGEAGRGFGVVAEEIRKLSDESKETVVKIRGLTESIKQKITETTTGSEMTLRAAEEQAAASQEITASVEEISSLASELNFIAKEI